MLRFGTAERRGAVHIPHIRAYLFGALRLATPADIRTAYTKGANISAWGGVCEMRHCERQRMNQGGEKGGEGGRGQKPSLSLGPMFAAICGWLRRPLHSQKTSVHCASHPSLSVCLPN
eukprot:COSAG03_NODE_6242_length_1090_cov_1362.549395_2_plen_118_part_00